jgi:hypothetical protein
MYDILETLRYLVNKEVEEILFTGTVYSLDPLQIKFIPSDDPINVRSLIVNDLKIDSNVLMIKYLNKFVIIGVIGSGIQAKCSLIKDSAQTIATSTTTKITFSTGDVDYDPSSMFDDANDRIIVPVDGLYEISMSSRWVSGGGSSDRAMYADVNGTSIYADMRSIGSSGRAGNSVSIKKYLNANDYVEMQVWQDSGGNRQIGGTGFYKLYFSVEKC